MFPPLTVGAKLVITKPDGHLNPIYIVDMILSHQITGFLITVPTLVSSKWLKLGLFSSFQDCLKLLKS